MYIYHNSDHEYKTINMLLGDNNNKNTHTHINLLQLNTYQCVLASDDQQHSYAIFLYNDIQWTTGDASGGDNGFNGRAAVIGYNIGDGKAHITLWNSGTNKSLELPSESNIRMPGVFSYSIHSGITINACTPDTLGPFCLTTK